MGLLDAKVELEPSFVTGNPKRVNYFYWQLASRKWMEDHSSSFGDSGGLLGALGAAALGAVAGLAGGVLGAISSVMSLVASFKGGDVKDLTKNYILTDDWLCYLSDKARRVSLPASSVEFEDVVQGMTSIPYVTKMSSGDTVEVEYLEDELDLVYISHWIWQRAAFVYTGASGNNFWEWKSFTLWPTGRDGEGAASSKMRDLCVGGLYVPYIPVKVPGIVESGLGSITSALGGNPALAAASMLMGAIEAKVDCSGICYPYLFPESIVQSPADKTTGEMAVTTVTYRRFPEIQARQLVNLTKASPWSGAESGAAGKTYDEMAIAGSGAPRDIIGGRVTFNS